jgi:hypothetical protein
MTDHVCEPPEWEGDLRQAVEEWTCPVCTKVWDLGWDENWDDAWRVWEVR